MTGRPAAALVQGDCGRCVSARLRDVVFLGLYVLRAANAVKPLAGSFD